MVLELEQNNCMSIDCTAKVVSAKAFSPFSIKLKELISFGLSEKLPPQIDPHGSLIAPGTADTARAPCPLTRSGGRV